MKEINSYNINMKSKGIRLNGNESYISLEENCEFKIFGALREVELNRYPDSDGVEARKAYSKYAKVKLENVVMGNGSDEMLGLIIGSAISKGKKLLTLKPDFSMYDFYTTFHEGEVIKYDCNKDGSFDVDEFILYGIKEEADIVIFSNPNNPTGYAVSNDEIEKILRGFKNKLVVVDEAYYEFNGESAVGLINQYKNLLVTRTLSKAWGLAAIRVGFMIGNEELVKNLFGYKVPYNVNSLSQCIATKMLDNPERVVENSKIIIAEREKFYAGLKDIEKESSLEIYFYKSNANYIYGRTPYKDILLKALDKKNIIIRSFEDDTFRITVGSPLENKKVIDTIKKAFVYEGE